MTKSIQSNYYDKDKLTKKELLFFRKALEEKRAKIQKNLTLTSKNLDSENNCGFKDEADHASNLIDTSTTNAIIMEQNKSLNQISRCLHKIQFSTYGICNMCEEAINIERLKVNIFSEHCISCREIIEKR